MPRAAWVAAPVAALVTIGTVGYGVVSQETGAGNLGRIVAQGSSASVADLLADREPVVSRSAPRVGVERDKQEVRELRRERRREQRRKEAREAAREATQRAIRNAETVRWTTTALDLWTAPADSATLHDVLDAPTKVLITGREGNGRVEIVLDGKAYWVTAGYLAEEKPEPEPVGPSSAACSNGTSVPSGVSPNVVAVHRATCAFAPEVTTYGTFRSGSGDHASGLAVDIMVSGDRGWQIAEYLRANYAELGIKYIIYAQNIWSLERASEGWRGMSDRGGTTANHYDHVHVSTY